MAKNSERENNQSKQKTERIFHLQKANNPLKKYLQTS